MQSNLSIIVDALSLGIPIKYDGSMYKLFDVGSTFELKSAVVSKQFGKESKWQYIGNLPFSIVFKMAKDLSDGERINLVFLSVQARESLSKGTNVEDLQFNFEDDFFEILDNSF